MTGDGAAADDKKQARFGSLLRRSPIRSGWSQLSRGRPFDRHRGLEQQSSRLNDLCRADCGSSPTSQQGRLGARKWKFGQSERISGFGGKRPMNSTVADKHLLEVRLRRPPITPHRGAEGWRPIITPRNNDASVRRRSSASTGLCSMAKPWEETSVSRSSAVSPVTSMVG